MRIIITCFLLITVGCSQHQNEVTLISDYIQKVDESTSYDLNFKLHNIEYEGNLLASDSIRFSLQQIRTNVDNFDYSFLGLSANPEELYMDVVEAKDNLYEVWSNDPDNLDEIMDGLDIIFNLMIENVTVLSGNNDLFDNILRLKRYHSRPDNILGHIYSISYEIDEPVLNVRKTVHGRFMLNGDLSAVVTKIE